MSASNRLAVLALTIGLLVPVAADAADDVARAVGSAPTLIKLCGGDDAPISADLCGEHRFDTLTERLEQALQAILTKAPAKIRPLLKRDQVWFGEIARAAADSVPQSDDTDTQAAFVANLRQRIATLEAIAAGLGRAGIAGRWANAFGSVVVTAEDGGSWRVAIETRSAYGTGSDRRRECQASALLRPEPGGWLTGTLLSENPAPTKTRDAISATAAGTKPPRLKIRRQGEALRIVADASEDAELSDCIDTGQITASYFAVGNSDAAALTSDAALVAPSFDCARPASATEEEICADPELAENDLRLNRAWSQLLPRLDEPTRRALTADQRGWIRAQPHQYPQFLHPAWEKQRSHMHFTGDARDKLNRLQRERIALLEGFDESRRRFDGVWIAHNAILKVTLDENGSLTAQGWKWEQGDWKAGCDYAMKGKVVKGAFRAEGMRKNPDTLERDHGSLIVNRLDDVFAKQRWRADGTAEPDADEPKCRQNVANSSTARLFPARPSPDIDNLGGAIR